MSVWIDYEGESAWPGIVSGQGSQYIENRFPSLVGRTFSEAGGLVGDLLGKGLDGEIDTRDLTGIGGSFFGGALTGFALSSRSMNLPFTVAGTLAGGLAGDTATTAAYDAVSNVFTGKESVGPVTVQSLWADGSLETLTHSKRRVGSLPTVFHPSVSLVGKLPTLRGFAGLLSSVGRGSALIWTWPFCRACLVSAPSS